MYRAQNSFPLEKQADNSENSIVLTVEVRVARNQPTYRQELYRHSGLSVYPLDKTELLVLCLFYIVFKRNKLTSLSYSKIFEPQLTLGSLSKIFYFLI